MSYAVSTATRHSKRSTPARAPRAWLLNAVWWTVLAPLPLAVVHLRQLWDKPYYQCYPLLIVIVGYLLWTRRPDSTQAPSEKPSNLSRVLLGLSLVLSVAGVLLLSPWLGMAALVSALGGGAARVAGDASVQRLLPVWALLWLLLPPLPGGDVVLVDLLDWMIWRTADAVLDRLGYLHWMVGGVLQLADRQFVLDDAFGPVNSPFVIFSAAAVLAVWKRRTIVPAALLMASAMLWFTMANVLRFPAVAAVFQRTGVDLSASPYAPWLLATTVGLMLLLLYSTDQLLRPLGATTYAIRSGFAKAVKFVSRPLRRRRVKHWVRRPQHDPSVSLAQPDSDQSRSVSPRLPRWRIGTVALVLLCIALAAIQLALMIASTQLNRPDAPLDLGSLLTGSSALPATIHGWTRDDSADPAPGSAQPGTPRVWNYAAGAARMTVTVETVETNGGHVLDHYQQRGWHVFRYRHNLRGLVQATRLPMLEAELVTPSGEAGVLMYTALDNKGRPRPALECWLVTQLRTTPLAALMRRWEGQSQTERLWRYRVAVFATAEDRLPPIERQQVRTALQEVTQRIEQAAAGG